MIIGFNPDQHKSVKMDAVTETFTSRMSEVQEAFSGQLLVIREMLDVRVNDALSNNDEIMLTESFKDFVDDSITLIRTLWNYIREIGKRFLEYMKSLFVNNEKLLFQYEERVKTLKLPKDFTFKGFNYTIPDNCPDIYAMQEYIHTISIEMNKMDLKVDREKVNKLRDTLTGDYYDKMRGKISTIGLKIPAQQFNNKLFEFFRDGEYNRSAITITKKDVEQMYDDLRNYATTIAYVNGQMKEIDVQYNNIINYFKNSYEIEKRIEGTIINTSDASYTIEEKNVKNFVNYMKLRSIQAENILNIFNSTFNMKIMALRDSHNQDVEILKFLLLNAPVSESVSIDEESENVVCNDIVHEYLNAYDSSVAYMNEYSLVMEALAEDERMLSENAIGDAARKLIEWIKSLITKIKNIFSNSISVSKSLDEKSKKLEADIKKLETDMNFKGRASEYQSTKYVVVYDINTELVNKLDHMMCKLILTDSTEFKSIVDIWEKYFKVKDTKSLSESLYEVRTVSRKEASEISSKGHWNDWLMEGLEITNVLNKAKEMASKETDQNEINQLKMRVSAINVINDLLYNASRIANNNTKNIIEYDNKLHNYMMNGDKANESSIIDEEMVCIEERMKEIDMSMTEFNMLDETTGSRVGQTIDSIIAWIRKIIKAIKDFLFSPRVKSQEEIYHRQQVEYDRRLAIQRQYDKDFDSHLSLAWTTTTVKMKYIDEKFLSRFDDTFLEQVRTAELMNGYDYEDVTIYNAIFNDFAAPTNKPLYNHLKEIAIKESSVKLSVAESNVLATKYLRKAYTDRLVSINNKMEEIQMAMGADKTGVNPKYNQHLVLKIKTLEATSMIFRDAINAINENQLAFSLQRMETLNKVKQMTNADQKARTMMESELEFGADFVEDPDAFLQEGINNATDMFFQTIMEAFKTFVFNLQKIIAGTDGVLKRKQKIMKKKMNPEAEITMYPYWVGYPKLGKRLPGQLVAVDGVKGIEKEEEFFKEHLSEYLVNGSNEDIRTQILTVLRGSAEPKKLTGNDINKQMQHMFTVIESFESIKTGFNSDINILRSNTKKVKTTTNNVADKSQNPEKTEPQKTNEADVEIKNPNAEGDTSKPEANTSNTENNDAPRKAGDDTSLKIAKYGYKLISCKMSVCHEMVLAYTKILKSIKVHGDNKSVIDNAKEALGDKAKQFAMKRAKDKMAESTILVSLDTLAMVRESMENRGVDLDNYHIGDVTVKEKLLSEMNDREIGRMIASVKSLSETYHDKSFDSFLSEQVNVVKDMILNDNLSAENIIRMDRYQKELQNIIKKRSKA